MKTCVEGARYGVHNLRHAFATVAIKAGWSAKKVAALLGHSSTAITLDMYLEDAPVTFSFAQ